MSNHSFPLPLPKFTFLCGGPQTARHALATAIANRDSEMLLQDFEEPLRNATHALFFGGFNIDRDLTKLEERSVPLPTASASVTVELWLAEFQRHLRSFVDTDALGRIALHNWIEDGQELFFQRALWRDTQLLRDIDPFVARFGADSCLCIYIGALGAVHRECLNIWLPTPDLDKQMLDLERELIRYREPDRYREIANAMGT